MTPAASTARETTRTDETLPERTPPPTAPRADDDMLCTLCGLRACWTAPGEGRVAEGVDTGTGDVADRD